MSRITELGEASSVSKDDYLLLSSPTLGERKILTKNIVGGSKSASRLVVFNKFNKDNYAQYRYTAEEDCTMICFNAAVNNYANNYDGMNSMITTTGTVIGTDTISDNYDSQNKVRNQYTVCKIISLSEGDTVTWSNNIPANMIVGLHIGIIVDFDINAFSQIEHVVQADNSVNTGTITIPSNGTYLLISGVWAGNNNNGRYSITHPNNETILFNPIANDGLIVRANPKIFTASANDSISYDFASFTSYVSKGYYLYKLT